MRILLAGLLGLASTNAAQGSQESDGLGYRGTVAEQKLSYRFWNTDGDIRGWQLFAPLSASAAFAPGPDAELNVTLKTGYIVSRYEERGFSGEVSTWSDTVLGLNFSFPGVLDEPGLTAFLTYDFNLPTGKATLYGDQKLALMDPDLVDLVRFGEGFNVNILAGFSYAIDTEWTVTVGGGFNWRGEYTPDGDTGFRYAPGDQPQGLVAVEYSDADMLTRLQVRYFGEEMGRLEGLDYFDPGDRVDVKLEAVFLVDETSTAGGTLFYATSGKNRYLNFFTGEVETEAFNGNGAVWVGQAYYAQRFDDVTASVFALYRVREKNDFDPVNDLFIPARTQWGAGFAADVALDETSSISFAASAGEVRDDATIFTGAERSYTTVSLSVSGRISF